MLLAVLADGRFVQGDLSISISVSKSINMRFIYADGIAQGLPLAQ